MAINKEVFEIKRLIGTIKIIVHNVERTQGPDSPITRYYKQRVEELEDKLKKVEKGESNDSWIEINNRHRCS